MGKGIERGKCMFFCGVEIGKRGRCLDFCERFGDISGVLCGSVWWLVGFLDFSVFCVLLVFKFLFSFVSVRELFWF